MKILILYNAIIASIVTTISLLGVNSLDNSKLSKISIINQSHEYQRLYNYFSADIYYYNDTIILTFKNRTDSINYYTLGYWLEQDISEDDRNRIEAVRVNLLTQKKQTIVKILTIKDKQKKESITKNLLFIDVDTCLLECTMKNDSIFLIRTILIDTAKTDWHVNYKTDSVYYSNAKGIWSFCYKDTPSEPICIYKKNGVERFYFDFSEKYLRGIIKTFDNKIIFYPERKVINRHKLLKIVIICLIVYFCAGILVFIIWRLPFTNIFKQIPQNIKDIFKPIGKVKKGKKKLKLIDYKSNKL